MMPDVIQVGIIEGIDLMAEFAGRGNLSGLRLHIGKVRRRERCQGLGNFLTGTPAVIRNFFFIIEPDTFFMEQAIEKFVEA